MWRRFVQLSQLKSDDYIDVELDLCELDVTASEQTITYQEIKDYIMEKLLSCDCYISLTGGSRLRILGCFSLLITELAHGTNA